jgi:hypothetical protein
LYTQLPGCIPATLHCTPIEPCPTINPPCHGGGYQGGYQAGPQTHVQYTNCPPMTVCPQPTTLCGPQPQQAYAGGTIHPTLWTQPVGLCPPPQHPQAYAGGTAATVCTQYGCHQTLATVCTQLGCPPPQAGGANFTPATVCTQLGCPPPCQAQTIHPTIWTQIQCGPQVQPGPTPTATFYPGCGHTCLPYTILPVTFPPGCQG